MFRGLFAFAALVLPWATFAFDVEKFDAYIEKTLTDNHVPGASVSIVEGDKVLLNKGYGVLKTGEPQKVNEDTIFQLASVTKAFTAAALGVQVDRGKVGWDDNIINHLPAFALKDPYPTRYATARDLLAHRTGLPAFGGDLLGKMGIPDQEILHRARFIEPVTSFRNYPNYSNMGYFIAGELIAALSGSSWEQSVQEDLLAPLKMNRSGFGAKLDNENVAYPHVKENGAIVAVDWDRTGGFPAAGAVTSTASDMAKWMSMFLTGGQGILKQETIQQMFAPSMVGEISFSEAPPISEETGFNFTLGWGSFHYSGHYIVEKGGGLDGIRTVTTLIPELNLGITVLCNLNLTLFPEVIRAEWLKEVVGSREDNWDEEFAKKQSILDGLLLPDPLPEHVLPPSQPLENYTGAFSNDLYGTVTVSKDGEKLSFLTEGANKYQGTLTHWSNDTFNLTWPTVNMGTQQVTFTMDPEGQAISMTTETLGAFRKINPNN